MTKGICRLAVVALLLGVAAARTVEASDALRTLGPNTWVAMNPKPRMAYESIITGSRTPVSLCDRVIETPEPVNRSYTGLAYGDGMLFFWGGGHGTHPGNDVDLYLIAQNQWEVQYEPECPAPGSVEANAITGAGSTSNSITPLGRPYTQHSYQQVDYDPVRKRFVWAGGAGTWAYDPATRRVIHLAGPALGTPSPLGMANHSLVYDPAGDRMVQFCTGCAGMGKRGVYALDLKTNKWSLVSRLPAAIDRSWQVYTAYNRDAREILVHLRPTGGDPDPESRQLWRYAPATDTWAKVTSFPLALREEAHNFDYDTLNRKVVFFTRAGKGRPVAVWAWDPSTDAWSELPGTSGAPAQVAGSDRGRVRYDPTHNVFFYLKTTGGYCRNLPGLPNPRKCGGPTATYAYRLAEGTPEGPFPPTLAFSSTAYSVPAGGMATLSWSTNATACTGSGAWSGPKPVSGTEKTPALSESRTYTLTCSGPGGTITRSLTVQSPTPTLTFTASPERVPAGSEATLSWSATGAAACHALAGWQGRARGVGTWQGTKPTSATESTGPIAITTAYTLTCVGPGGSVSKSILVHVADASQSDASHLLRAAARTVEAVIPRVNRAHASEGPPTLSAPLAIPLRVTEPAGVRRVKEPVTSGIPLPSGAPTSGWSLWDAGEEIPVQVTSLPGRTPWILLDFQIDVAGGGTRTLTLKHVPPKAAPPAPLAVTEERADTLTTTQVVDAISGQTLSGTRTRATWEYEGALRATRRIDGRYGDLLAYTTRITFYAGLDQVKVEHVLRNSVQRNERHVKVASATVKVGDGTTVIRAPRPGSISTAGSGVTLEMVPPKHPLDRRGRPVEGGWMIPDLSHMRATVILGGTQKAAQSPLHALAPPAWYADHAHLSTARFSTLDDEKEAYRRWGWAFTDKQLPTWPHDPDYFVSWHAVETHGETESDDLWQNIVMYLRTGIRGFWDRALGWARYHKDEYSWRTDGFDYAWDDNREEPAARVERPLVPIPLTDADRAFLRGAKPGRAEARDWGLDHLWGWGLVDYYYLTGDRDALEAAVDLAEISERMYWWKARPDSAHDGGDWDIGPRGRQGARQLLLVTRVWEATQAARWRRYADALVHRYLTSRSWDPRGSFLGAKALNGVPAKVMNPHHTANISLALDNYHQATGDTRVRERLIKMAEFARQYGMDPVWHASANAVWFDYPKPGDFHHPDFEAENADLRRVSPYHTLAWIDTLVRGWRFTGDVSFLERAKFHWARASKFKYHQLITDPPFAADDQVGHFVHSKPDRRYFESHGQFQHMHLLFAEYARNAIPPNLSPRVSLTASASTVAYGAPVRLAWSTEHARSCRADGAWAGSQPPSGSETTQPLRTRRTFVLTCDGAAGLATTLVTVDVSAAPALGSSRGLELLYTFDEADRDGAVVIDRSGKGRNAIVKGGQSTAGRVGEALSLDGTDDHVVTRTDVDYGPTFSLSFWFRVAANDGNGRQTLFSHGSEGRPYSLTVYLVGSGNRDPDLLPNSLVSDYRFVREPSGKLAVPAAPWVNDRWHLYTLTVAAGRTALYIDGTEVGSLPVGGAPFNPSAKKSLYMGTEESRRPGRALKGAIDELRIYSRPLSADEIRALHGAGRS